MVASVTGAWLVSEGAVHDRAGYILLALVALRIVWGFVGPPHARFADFIRSHRSTLLYARLVIAGREPRYMGHNPLGGWMIVALLATALAAAISGWVYTTDAFWGVAWVERAHVFFAELLLVLAALHVAGVAFTSIRHRENLVAGMLHGKKRATDADDAAGVRRTNQGEHREETVRSTTTAAVIAALVVPLGSATAEPAKEGYMPGLVEIMLTTQSHHAKLWRAGSVGNWELAAYQADELKEGLEEAGELVPDYKGIPVGKMVDDLIMPRIEEVESAIKARDRAKVAAASDKLTAACNSCHQGSNRGFIVVQRPPASAFPNQSFAPKRK